jgi:hypothetical protein
MSPEAETAGAAKKVKSSGSTAGAEYGFPHGHFGHLNPEEEDALRNFKLFLQEKGIYTPGPPPSHDDPTLLYVRVCVHCPALYIDADLAMISKTIPACPPLGCTRCLSTVQRYRGLESREPPGCSVRYHRPRFIRAVPETSA